MIEAMFVCSGALSLYIKVCIRVNLNYYLLMFDLLRVLLV